MQRMTVTLVRGQRVRLVDQVDHVRIGRPFGGYKPAKGDEVAATFLNGELVVVCSWAAWQLEQEATL